MAVEARRLCGYRRVGGLYMVGGGLAAPCDRMPYPLDRCPTCGGGVKFTRGHTWLQPDFFEAHEAHEDCMDLNQCPVCGTLAEPAAMCLLWIGRAHYSPESYLKESGRLGISRRIPAIPKGLVLDKTWVLLAHLDAVPPVNLRCVSCGLDKLDEVHFVGGGGCKSYQAPEPTPGIFTAFVPHAVELLLKQSEATPERIEKEAKRGVTVVAVPDDDKDHQGSVWDKEDSQPELPGVN